MQAALVSVPSSGVRRRYAVGASNRELVELFGLNRQTVSNAFASAVTFQGGHGNGRYFSRAAISDLLSEWNGRPVAYPSVPLLTLAQVRAMLLLAGHEVSNDAIVWAAQKNRTPRYKAHNRRPTPALEIVKIGWVVRVTQDAALDFVERWSAYAGRKV